MRAHDKRDGFGRGNWGSVQDEVSAGLEAPAQQPADPEPAATGWGDSTSWGDAGAGAADAQAAPADAADESQEAPAEPEGPQELTLDEWKRQQEPRSKPQFQLRRAGEGENTAQWKNMYELKKKREDDEESEEEDADDEVRGEAVAMWSVRWSPLRFALFELFSGQFLSEYHSLPFCPVIWHVTLFSMMGIQHNFF